MDGIMVEIESWKKQFRIQGFYVCCERKLVRDLGFGVLMGVMWKVLELLREREREKYDPTQS